VQLFPLWKKIGRPTLLDKRDKVFQRNRHAALIAQRKNDQPREVAEKTPSSLLYCSILKSAMFLP
jgi:hypothetical protein